MKLNRNQVEAFQLLKILRNLQKTILKVLIKQQRMFIGTFSSQGLNMASNFSWLSLYLCSQCFAFVQQLMNNTGNNQFALNQTRNHKEDDFSPNCMGQDYCESEVFHKKNPGFCGSIFKNPTLDTQRDGNSETLFKKSRSKIEWSPQEDNILFQNYIKEGSKWAELAKLLPNKSQNSIKNRFYCCIRKVQKKINIIQKTKKISHRKPVSLESLLTFMELGKSNLNYIDGRFKYANEKVEQIILVKEAIIEQAMKPQSELNESKIEQILAQILELKHSLKFINVKRVKKTHKYSLSELKRKENSSTLDSDFQDNKEEAETAQKASEFANSTNPNTSMPADLFLMDHIAEEINNRGQREQCSENLFCLDKESFDHNHLIF